MEKIMQVMKKIFKRSLTMLLQKTNILVGGQAVIEGVMMRVPGAYATAVRNPEGGITIDRKEHIAYTQRHKILGWPVIRGVVSLFEAMKIGYATLSFSAEASGEEEMPEKKNFWHYLGDALTMLISFGLALLLFFILPLWLTSHLFQVEKTAWAFNISAGGFRIIFFLVYLLLISLMKDVKRLFRYHGAEHKTVYAFEAGTEMNLADLRPFTTYHPRCGTSFLFISLITAIIMYAIIDGIVMLFTGELTLTQRLLFHLPLVPLVAGIGYEGIKFTSRNMENPWIGWMTKPGLWLQRITTQAPDDSMLEVALAALKEAFGEKWNDYKGKKYQADAIE
ncbi:MAG TPA: DUF1385 domain-containing protein [Candidatus Marinimicrobia bacterium]|nr:DUF1385 domain-containing protein [Candidatus Neomarinimicrobiota bacterium]